MDVQMRQLPEAFDLPEWRQLLQQDPTRHIFATPEWNRLWWSQFGEGQRGLVLTFHEPRVVGLAAFTVDDTARGRRLRFLGGDDLTDYQGPLIAGEQHRPGVAEALLCFLRDEFGDWDYFEAKGLPVPFHFSEWLVEAADRMGLAFDLELHELTAVLGLPSSRQEYLETLGKKRRHELERKVRRFGREAPGARLRTSDAARLDADVEAFIRLHRASEGAKGEFMLPRRAAFFAHVARALQPAGMLSLDCMELDGRLIAGTFGFRFDNVFYLYNSAYDLNLRAISPGLVLVTRLIERAVDEGFRRFDFLRGRERYKYDLGAEPLPLHSIVIPNPSRQTAR